MMRRLMESVEAKRRGEKQGGFTLIELIVVVVIIGILAAVAIPSFLSQRSRAFNASVISDMRNTATELESFFAGNLRYPEAADVVGASATALDSVNISNEVTLRVWIDNSFTAGDTGFVIVGEHQRTGEFFLLDSQGGSTPIETALTEIAPHTTVSGNAEFNLVGVNTTTNVTESGPVAGTALPGAQAD